MIVDRFGSIISIGLYSISLMYIRDLEKEKCSCAYDWRLNYIKYHSWLRIVMSVLSLHPNIEMNNLHMIPNISTYLTAASILEIYAHITWISDIEKNCECSKDWKQTFIKIYFWLIAILNGYNFLIVFG